MHKPWPAKIIQSIGEWSQYLILVMTLLCFVIVVLRYAFGLGWVWLQESMMISHAMNFMLAGAWTLSQDGHVKIDILYQRLSPQKQAWIDIFGTVFFLMPMMLMILWQSWPYVLSSWAIREVSQESGGLPALYLVKSLIPLYAFLLILQGSLIIFERIQRLRLGKWA